MDGNIAIDSQGTPTYYITDCTVDSVYFHFIHVLTISLWKIP